MWLTFKCHFVQENCPQVQRGDMPICVSSLHTRQVSPQDHHGGGHQGGVWGQAIVSWGSTPPNFFNGFVGMWFWVK
jgi:hypothetical protein